MYFYALYKPHGEHGALIRYVSKKERDIDASDKSKHIEAITSNHFRVKESKAIMGRKAKGD